MALNVSQFSILLAIKRLPNKTGRFPTSCAEFLIKYSTNAVMIETCHHVRQKTAPFYFRNNFLKLHSVWILCDKMATELPTSPDGHLYTTL